MYKLFISIIFFLLSMSCIAQENFKIERENTTSTHELGISKFYFVHQTFADSFFMMNLQDELSYDEMTKILKNIYDGVTLNEAVRIEYSLDKEVKGKVAYFVKDNTKDGKIFIMLTNFNNESRKFDEKVDSKDQLARWYFIRGDKLVYRKDLYSKEKEEKARKGKPFELIDMYLFDDNVENDAMVKPLIDSLLKSETSGVNKLYGYLYLSEYHLLNNNLTEATKAINDMKKLFETDMSIDRAYALIVNMGTTELEIMKRM